jgi:hypothetical protein
VTILAGKGGGNAKRQRVLSRAKGALQNIGVGKSFLQDIIQQLLLQMLVAHNVGKCLFHALLLPAVTRQFITILIIAGSRSNVKSAFPFWGVFCDDFSKKNGWGD